MPRIRISCLGSGVLESHSSQVLKSPAPRVATLKSPSMSMSMEGQLANALRRYAHPNPSAHTADRHHTRMQLRSAAALSNAVFFISGIRKREPSFSLFKSRSSPDPPPTSPDGWFGWASEPGWGLDWMWMRMDGRAAPLGLGGRRGREVGRAAAEHHGTH